MNTLLPHCDNVCYSDMIVIMQMKLIINMPNMLINMLMMICYTRFAPK